MLIQTWADVLTQSFYDLGSGIAHQVPTVIVAIIIFLVGWLVGAALGKIVDQIVKSIKLDQGLKATGLNDVVERAGFTLDSGAFLGALVKWFFIIVFLMASLEVLGLTQVTLFLQTVVLAYLPQVIVAVLMILVGAVVADVVKGIVAGAAKAAGISGAGFAGSVAKWSVWIFTILAALAQLQVATAFVQTLFTGVVIAISLAIGLSFGLGGQEAAARAIERAKEEMANHHH